MRNTISKISDFVGLSAIPQLIPAAGFEDACNVSVMQQVEELMRRIGVYFIIDAYGSIHSTADGSCITDEVIEYIDEICGKRDDGTSTDEEDAFLAVIAAPFAEYTAYHYLRESQPSVTPIGGIVQNGENGQSTTTIIRQVDLWNDMRQKLIFDNGWSLLRSAWLSDEKPDILPDEVSKYGMVYRTANRFGL